MAISAGSEQKNMQGHQGLKIPNSLRICYFFGEGRWAERKPPTLSRAASFKADCWFQGRQLAKKH